MPEEKSRQEGEGGVFLDDMAATQAHNIEWFKQVVGAGWPRASKVMDLCDVLLSAFPQSRERMHEERVRAVTALLHAAKRAGSTGLLSFGRGQWLEAQPQFRRYVECFGFARIAWERQEDAIVWFRGVQSPDAYDAYRDRYGRLLTRALRTLHPSLVESHDAFSKGTHSSFHSVAHAMSSGGDKKTLELNFDYFDVGRVENTAGYVLLFLETMRVLLLCQETFAVRTFGTRRWRDSWRYWATTRTPVVKEWLALEKALRRRVGLPDRDESDQEPGTETRPEKGG
jgi:hypothetical protein